jgi:hypothetical protein
MEEMLPKGARVEKCNSQPQDRHRDGARGVVVATLGPVDILLGYFVRWDDLPNVPVFIAYTRVRPGESIEPSPRAA